MTISHIRNSFSLLLLVGTSILHAQQLDSMIAVYAKQYPQEKIYVHFDKNAYKPGETIWYKAYLFADGSPSQISKNFYAELTDSEGHVLIKNINPIISCSASGSFDLPETIKNERLYIRAYTAWMKNFDTAFFFKKGIPIIGNKKGSETPIKHVWHFQLFPEGGDLVAGIENNIAFKANDQFGIPYPVNGIIKTKSGKEMAQFKSEHNGMGSFLITPPDTNDLYAYWRDGDSIDRITPLPKIKKEGAVLHLKLTDSKLIYTVSRSLESDHPIYEYLLVAYMNQSLVYKAKIKLKESFKSGGQIPIKDLPSGILQATLLSNNGSPVAERIVFINNHNFECIPKINIIKQNTAK